MTTPNQLILVPPGIAHFRPGIHRVVAANQRQEQFVALFWLMEAGDGDVGQLHKNCRKPTVYSWKAVAQHLESGLFSRVDESFHEQRSPSNAYRLKATHRESFDRNKAILTPLIEAHTLVSMLCHGMWKSKVDEVAAQHKVHATTVLRLLSRYFTLKMDIDWASEDQYWHKSKCRIIKNKLGRPVDRYKSGHRLSARGRNVNESDRTCIKAHYHSLENQKITKSAMYRKFEQNFGPKKIVSNSKGTVEVQKDSSIPLISERQFRYHLSQIIGELQLLKTEAGERRINLSHRPITGNARDRIPYPGHTYIVDATVADVFLVSAFDRRRLIGRPVIYLVVDAFSSVIVGLHVALEGPNLEQARIAICRAVSDKKKWLSWLNIPELAQYFPQGCIPTFWLADRGELHSEGSRELQLKLRSNLSIAASYRADWKALVERAFGVINAMIIHWMPGAVTARKRERGERDTRLDASLTLKEFTRILARGIAVLNFTKDMSKHLSAAFITREVVPNPLGFWHDGIANKHGSAVFLDEETALRKMMPQREAQLSRMGISDDKSAFVAPWMKDHPSVELSGFTGNLPVKLISSVSDPAAAWCLLPQESTMREVSLKRTLADANLYCAEDFREFDTLKRFVGEDMVDDTRATSLEIRRQNDKDIQTANAATQLANNSAPLSKRQRSQGISANRRAERDSVEATRSGTHLLPEAKASKAKSETVFVAEDLAQGDDDYFSRISRQLDCGNNP